MLYLDSSVLVKRYSDERGSRAVAARFESGEKIFTSMLSFAEVHSSISRKFRSRELTLKELQVLRENFTEDWLFSLNILNLDVGTMSALPQFVETHELRAGDALHLSAACWLRDTNLVRKRGNQRAEIFEFGVSDKRLAKIARECGLQVFNPEE
ncbi:MAG TPA: type II toxin-antitoxin system VapC family toxin [Candidatus Saccharimonadales bacterium]|jgi:predicted nucleic acid-binding protein|nr:type II toxin-antitoxin system VapC family toxin [Candidatus Saccharimonadales bacterium]